MRLAFFSPLNPVPSGISDYSEELLPLLARSFEIDLVVDNYRPANPALSRFRIRSVDEFKRSAREFDLVLYQMGNSPAHANIFRTLREIPGVVVMHDVVLHHLRAWQTLDRGDAAGYIQAMREDYGEAGAELARLEALGLPALDRFDYPLNGAVVRAVRALIVHSEYASRQIQSLAPDTPVAVIPMGITPTPEISTAEARARLDLPAGAFVVAAFGEIHPYKRITVALQAFAEFRAQFPDSLFLLIGRESPNYEPDAIIRAQRLGEAVRRIGFAPGGDYANYIAAADVCLNLRYPTAGETSASLLRLFAAGKAVIVTRTGAYAELPDNVCAKIEADEYEQDLLRAHLEFLAQRADVRAALGANARAFALSSHSPEQAAAAYVDFLKAVSQGRAESRSYLGWKAAETRGREDNSTRGDGDAPRDPPSPWDPPRGTAGRGTRLRGPSSLSAPGPAFGVRSGSERERHRDTGTRRRGDTGTPGDGGHGSEAGHETSPHSPLVSFPDLLARDYVEMGLDANDPALTEVARAIVELGLSEGKQGT